MKTKDRTVAALLSVKPAGAKGKGKNRNKEEILFPRHTYVYCRSRAIAERFLRDAESEGFLFSDGAKPTEKGLDDIFALNSDFTMSYTGLATHVMFGAGGDNTVWIDYGKYVSGEKEFRGVER